MKRSILAAALAFGLATTSQAAVIASSTFDTNNEGWRIGEFTALDATTSAATYDAAGQLITTTDVEDNVAFLAPAAYLGNQSAAFGGNLSFLVSDTANDNPKLYSAVSLTGAGMTLFSTRVPGPSTSFTPYSVTLTGANFITSNPFTAGGAAATDAQLQAVLADLDQLSILADWHTGADFSRLDNVVFAGLQGAIPEPGAWAMLIAGFGLVGAALRSRRRSASEDHFAANT